MMLRTNIQNMPLNDKMERMTGIEPASRAWKARVLPLNHIRKILVGTTGSFCEKRSCGSFCHKLNFEMTISKARANRRFDSSKIITYNSQNLSTFPAFLVGTTGIEPATSCSQSKRATRLRHVPKQFLYIITNFKSDITKLLIRKNL